MAPQVVVGSWMLALRVADAVEEAVDLAVAQRRAVLVGLELGGQREVAQLPAHRGEQLLHRRARARAGVADVEALALEVGEGLDVGFLARQHGERLGVHREHRAQVAVGAGVLELAQALGGVVLHVGLREAQVELAGLDGVDVEHRAAGGLHRAADAVLGAVLVDQAADRAAGRVVDAGDAAGADGDELLLRERRARARSAARAAAAAASQRRERGCACHRGSSCGCDQRSRADRAGDARVDRRAQALRRCASSSASLAMNGGASSTWSPCRPSTVPPIG